MKHYKSLYQHIKQSRQEYDHHQSDLYIKATHENILLCKKLGASFEYFTSEIDRERWLDIPFAYDPFWEKRERMSRRLRQ